MNRRRFIQSLAAVLSLPAMPSLSLAPASAALPTAAAVPNSARYWAIYMSQLHGECPPHALQAMLNISAGEARNYVTQLVAEGVIKPNPLLQKSVSKIVRTDEENLLDKLKKQLEMKEQAESDETKTCERVDASECLDAEAELSEDLPSTEPEDGPENDDGEADAEAPLQNEIKA